MSNAPLFPKLRKRLGTRENLPDIPGKILDFFQSVIESVDGHAADEPLPCWKKILSDPNRSKFIMAGRQTGKSTYIGIKLLFHALGKKGRVAVYVTHDETNLSHFSNHKFRRGLIGQNSKVKVMVKGSGLGQRGEVAFKNGSSISLVTDEGQYKHVEGKSANYIACDEFQYHESQYLPVLREAMSFTQGELELLGRGGEAGSEMENLSNQTTQSEFKFKDPFWRGKLQFGKRRDGTYGFIPGEYLQELCDGEYVAQKPENYLFPGYHLPQMMFPHIPLTIEDAINKYRISPEFSIEWKRKHYPRSMYVAHVEAGFYKASRRPITRDMVKACMEPYRDWHLLSPSEVLDLKATYGKRCTVLMGVDWGSSSSGNSATCVSILVKIKQVGGGNENARYILAYIHKVNRGEPGEPEIGPEEAYWVANLFKSYSCDYGVADLGYGEQQVKTIQEGGFHPKTGEKWHGLHSSKFIGCRTIRDIVSPEQDRLGKVNEELEEASRLQTDKTHIIDNFVNFIGWYTNYIPLGERTVNEAYRKPKLLIPYEIDYAVEWLIDEFTSITRKDLEKVSDVRQEDPRVLAVKEYNHPPDSVMSICYALVADQNFRPGGADFKGTFYLSGRSRV